MTKKKSGKGTKRVKVSIPAELAVAIEAAGGDVEETVERLLRDALGKPTADKGKTKLAGFLQDLAGPHLPQLEAIAKDVAARVAKDVATAAAAAALTTFAAKAAGDNGSPDTNGGPPLAAKPRKPAANRPGPRGD